MAGNTPGATAQRGNAVCPRAPGKGASPPLGMCTPGGKTCSFIKDMNETRKLGSRKDFAVRVADLRIHVFMQTSFLVKAFGMTPKVLP